MTPNEWNLSEAEPTVNRCAGFAWRQIPCWIEPPGRRWSGQRKFQRPLSAMPILGQHSLAALAVVLVGRRIGLVRAVRVARW